MIHLHLISAPWSTALVPSAATGQLHAYVNENFSRDEINVFQHSAHTAIPLLLMLPNGQLPFETENRQSAETYYFLLYLRRFLAHEESLPEDSFQLTLDKFNQYLAKKKFKPVTVELLNQIEEITINYINDELDIHNADPKVTKVYGFSVNFAQAYSSMFMHRVIKENRPTNTKFLYGGAATTNMTTSKLFKRLVPESFFVKGDGEIPLHEFLENLIKENLNKQVLTNSEVSKNLQTLVPNYDEYFIESKKYLNKRTEKITAIAKSSVPLEGSRGCYYKCTFCSFSAAKEIYRTKPSESVFNEFQKLKQKYYDPETVYRFRFQDNLCDDWAEDFADLLINDNNKVPYIMMLRATHPQSFWEKMRRSGLYLACIGIENFSGPLLNKIIKKGSPPIFNISVMKYMKELNIKCHSNIVTHYPESTLEDIAENKRVLKKIIHLDRLSFFPVKLYSDSPLYNNLSDEEKSSINTVDYFGLPYDLNSYSAEPELEMPERYILDPTLFNEWTRFILWTKNLYRATRKYTLECESLPNETIITENGKVIMTLTGNDKVVFDTCHTNYHLKGLAKKLDHIEIDELEEILERLSNTKAMIKSQKQYISLPLRKEITVNYYKNGINESFDTFG
jgi:radical SAM superfamily enzyme YgiQ (UPF0313 family)